VILRERNGLIWNERLVHPAKAFFVAAKTVSAVVDVAKRGILSGKALGNSLSGLGQQNISFAWVFEWWDRLVIEADKALDYWLPIEKKSKLTHHSRRTGDNSSSSSSPSSVSVVHTATKRSSSSSSSSSAVSGSSTVVRTKSSATSSSSSSRSSKRTSTSTTTSSIEFDDTIFEMEIEPPSTEDSEQSDNDSSELADKLDRHFHLDSPEPELSSISSSRFDDSLSPSASGSSSSSASGSVASSAYSISEFKSPTSPPFRHSLVSVSVELTRRLAMRLKQNVIIRTFARLLEPSERFFSIIIDTFYVHVKVFSSADSFLTTVRNKVTFQFSCKWDDRLNNPLLSFYSDEKVYMRGA